MGFTATELHESILRLQDHMPHCQNRPPKAGRFTVRNAYLRT